MKKTLVNVLLTVFAVAFTVAPVSGVVDKVPTGKTVLYTFTGVVDNTNVDNPDDIRYYVSTSTCVTCTDTGGNSTEVTVQFFDSDEDLWEATNTFGVLTTMTFCSSETAFYSDETISTLASGTDMIDQGFIRVVVDKKEAGNVICNAVVVNPTPNWATYTMFINTLPGERSKKKYKTSK